MVAIKQPIKTPHKTQPEPDYATTPTSSEPTQELHPDGHGNALRGTIKYFLLLAILYVGQATVTGFWSQYIETTRQQGAKALEADRFRAQLITLAASSNDADERLERLQFLLDPGLLEDKGGQIKKAVDAKKVPKLPAQRIQPGASVGDDEPRNIFWQDMQGRRITGGAGALQAEPQHKQ